jgi:hypothetical protein
MSTRKDEPQGMGEVLRQFTQTHKLEKGLDNAKIVTLWAELLGPGVKAYTDSVRLSGTTLHVKLSSSVLREELAYGKESIINMLNEALKKEVIEKIILR